ncbi:MAG TPA: hypothetical protein VM597_35300 [Gemmataceae bacterium]|jgi:hypothetical protein|nr:hypothetical protein [Gemmataceae bacterium]
MTNSTGDQLLAAIQELRALFPDWRVGQLVASLTQAAGRDRDGAIWDVEDDELLAAARRLVDRNRAHRAPGTDQDATPDRGGVMPFPRGKVTEPPRQVT